MMMIALITSLLSTNMIRVAALPSPSQLASEHSNSIPSIHLTPEERTRNIWRQADAVCFDVDSTVCEDEAIDEFAAFLGVGDEVRSATARAMNGSTRFRDALAVRLAIMKPTRCQMQAFKKSSPPKLTQGIKELVRKLHSRGTPVYLVSGGFRELIRPVADLLEIPHERIYANEILFDKSGAYNGFDTNELTSDSGSKSVGKAGVCALLKSTHNYRHLVMVGDGATDLEACPPADAFIGFGGNAVRPAVRDGADWFVTSFETLNKALH